MSKLYHTRSRKTSFTIGSNQYKKFNKNWIHPSEYFLILVVALCLNGIHAYVQNVFYEWDFQRKLISPLASPVFAHALPTPTPTQEMKPTHIVTKIYEAWEPYGPQEQFKALHIAKNESGHNVKSVGYNCHYNGISTACKKEDRSKAWSVDCGLFQINVLGQQCPAELFDPDVNIQRAVTMYQQRGWQPWVAARKLGYTN